MCVCVCVNICGSGGVGGTISISMFCGLLSIVTIISLVVVAAYPCRHHRPGLVVVVITDDDDCGSHHHQCCAVQRRLKLKVPSAENMDAPNVPSFKRGAGHNTDSFACMLLRQVN